VLTRRARPSVFDLWPLGVCGRPPAASEGVGPPRLKTKTSSETAKISLREREAALRAALTYCHMWGCVPTPIREVAGPAMDM